MRLGLYLTLVVLFFAGVVCLRRGYRRWEVSGRSMMPALEPGDWLIVERVRRGGRPVRPGDIVLAGDPREQARTLVKRVVRIDEDGLAWLEGDNPAESTDSRHFGAVGVDEILGRVRWRYWPPRRVGRLA
ncbi:MAG: nickel-type superoxide dismutase maturation protease [Chloroflexi bacterium]|nr:nickel-type superoxide dismutase maturation protease [Chloroflexota bacterium]NJD66320.1 nickel-type superoxide dismutase maturation protease [Chloroflexota bacterium]PWB71930.1 MAG: nickel-type superoxide dismutase maturation protease [Holophagae bacterium]